MAQRLTKIEDWTTSSLQPYNNLKLITRGRPFFIDPQMGADGGGVPRFGSRRGFNFTALLPENQSLLIENAFRATSRITVQSRPSWMQVGTLVRIGQNEKIGELHLVEDLVGDQSLDIRGLLAENYSIATTSASPPVCSLVGTPLQIYAPAGPPDTVMAIESGYKMVPGDVILMSQTEEILASYAEYRCRRVDFQGTRTGLSGEPPILYRYFVELDTQTGRLPFVPLVGATLFLKALPCFIRGPGIENLNTLAVPQSMGPFLLDAYSGGMISGPKVGTELGVQLFDAFDQQILAPVDQEWQLIKKNHIILERSIKSDSMLFWQRVTGNFQFVQNGYFQAELDSSGEFYCTSDLLVPPWPADIQRGWVIPILARAPATVVITFEPQAPQIYSIPSNALTFIRPKIFVGNEPIQRITVAIASSPNSRVEIRDWQFDGQEVVSLNYYILGTGQAFGVNHWMGGAFQLKPLFFDLSVLRGRYSDGVTRRNAGFIYS